MICVICNKELTKSSNNNLYYCSIQTTWIESMRRNLKYHHCFISLNRDQNILSKLITVPPYIFEINYEKNIIKVSKITSFKQKGLIDDVFTLDLDHEEKEYLNLDIPLGVIIDFPWHDLEKLEKKLRIYNLFS